MNKGDLIGWVAKDAGISKAAATRAVDSMLAHIKESLTKGEDVQLIGFGGFTLRERAARTGRNPRTGETMTIPAGRTPVWRPSKEIKDATRTAA